MPPQLAMVRTLTATVGIALLLMCTVLSGFACASATITPSFSPDRLNARGALTLTIRLTGGRSGVPSPARRSVVKLPAGLGLNIPTLRSCSVARLRARGAAACPPQSQIGAGQALVEASAGSQLLMERIRLTVFLGPLHNFQPTFEVLGEGLTPLQERIVLTGAIASGGTPYGEELVMSIPAIPSLPLEPDAALATLTLTIGTSTDRLANTVVVPHSCSREGFPFATEFTYADGSSDSAVAKASCPHQPTKAGATNATQK
ncbi:MAG: hypothetical protein ACYDHN_01515 [Solirubrobacteraceae bacterium]